MALRWLIEQPAIITPIIGARSAEQLNENLSAADLRRTDDALDALGAVSTPVPGGYPYGAFGTGQGSRTSNKAPRQIPGSDAPTDRA